MKHLKSALILVLLFCLAPINTFASSEYCDEYGHDWYYSDYYFYDDYEYRQCDNTNHYRIDAYCLNCDEVILTKEKHSFDYDDVVKLATPASKGTVRYYCEYCGKTINKKRAFKRGSSYSKCYDIKSHSYINRNSKVVKVKLANALKGSVLKIKIGKKTYTKKIRSTKKTVKVKIKKPVKFAQKVKITVLYKGKVIGTDQCEDWDVVWYGNSVKVGMTKKQVKYTWGSPSDTSSASGGWSFWHWSDGSYVDFKNGRVKYWYDAAG